MSRTCAARGAVHGEAPGTLARRYAHAGLGREHGDLVRRERAALRTLQPLGPLESESAAFSCGGHLAIRDARDALDEPWAGMLLRGARGDTGRRAGRRRTHLSIGLIAQRRMMSSSNFIIKNRIGGFFVQPE